MDESYTHIAPFYDAVTSCFLQSPRKRIVGLCQEWGVRRVADVGCGTGVLTQMLSRQGMHAVGIDQSRAMLAQAPKKLVGNKAFGSCLYVQGGAGCLPFALGILDMIIFFLVLHETAACTETLLEEAFRVAPYVLVVDWRMPERNLDYLSIGWVHGIERLAGRGHYARFRAFMATGGINGLVRRAGVAVAHREYCAGGALDIALLKKV